MGVKEYVADYPKRVFFILGSKFSERFSFYGMKAILVIYLNRRLNFNENTSTSIYHAFNMVTYFMPILGAVLADGFFGKYKIIMVLSVVYALGNAVMSLTAIPPMERVGPFIGLFLLAIGSGGIEPCVASFGGDQFSEHQKSQQMSFFSVFYMSINLGSLASTILTPILRAGVQCFQNDCYPLAFGVPAILMVVALVFYAIGTPWYTHTPPQGNVIGRMFKAIGKALSKKCKSKEKKDHWMEHAHPEFSKTFIRDVQAVLRVLFMFIPLPIFWALFDQQGSRWTLQAGKMNGQLGSIRLEPDQIQAVNPLLVIILVPILESVVFPLLKKCGFEYRLLQRITSGMVLTAVAFVLSGFLQIAIDNTKPPGVPEGKSQVKVINAAPCTLNFTTAYTNGTMLDKSSIGLQQASGFLTLNRGNYSITYVCSHQNASEAVQQNVVLTNKERYLVAVSYMYPNESLQAQQFKHKKPERPIKGRAAVSIINALDYFTHVNLSEKGSNKKQSFANIPPLAMADNGRFREIRAQRYYIDVNYFDMYQNYTVSARLPNSLITDNGGVYTVVIQYDPSANTSVPMAVVHNDIRPNEVNMMWQIPQYFVITLGECLVSVTGLSFAYSQAPASMKAVCQAAWSLTTAIGNLIVLIIAQAGNITDRAAELFFFAILMVAATIIFAIMSLFYTYASFDENIEEPRVDDNVPSVAGNDNPAFVKEADVKDALNVTVIQVKPFNDTATKPPVTDLDISTQKTTNL